MQTTNTPVAKGSSVPAWPTLAGRTSLCTRLTASREVHPVGLLMLRIPNIFSCRLRLSESLSFTPQAASGAALCQPTIMQDTESTCEFHFEQKAFLVTDDPTIAEFPTNLPDALREIGIELADPQIELLDRYRELLWKWNEQLNLTRHTTLEKFVTRDIVDSWELAKLLPKRERVLDIGTGGGVPGLVLAICRPDLRVSVCESVQKKAKVVEAMVVELNLPVSVYGCRAEEVLQLQTFDTLVARGVAALAKILRWLEPHWSAFDRLLLIKGRKWVEERGEARHLGLLKKLDLRKAAVYLTPRVDAESVILSITLANHK
jgi:16S rRNA (guanine527-N7)-methyltransferase